MRSLQKAMAIVDRLAEAPDRGISELSREIGADKAMVHRIVRTMAERGWVVQDPGTRRYQLGPALRGLRDQGPSREDIIRAGTPSVTRLAKAFDETALLSVREGLRNVVQIVEPSTQEIRVVSEVGRSVPLHCGAAGKVLLSFDHPSVTARVIDAGLERWTDGTITDGKRLRAELDSIRKQGWAVENEEYSRGVCGLGAPVFDAEDRIVAALALRAPALRVDAELIGDMARALLEEAGIVGRALGRS